MTSTNNIIGIDIGSLIISSVLINDEKEIIQTKYIPHEGDIRTNIIKILNEYNSLKNIQVAFTSSRRIPLNDINYYDPQVSYITAAKHFHSNIESILIAGAEKFGLIQFDENGQYQNYKSNTSCAAGTGSFLDQQSKRLNLSCIEEFCETALNNNDKIPGIASRCAVFAKTDLIHAQQEGYSIEEICDGLSFGLAKNIVDTLFKKNRPEKQIIFTGGVSKNLAVKNHLSKILSVDVITDQYSHVYGAVGAALSLLAEINIERLNKNNKSKIKNFNYNEIEAIITQKTEKKLHFDKLKLLQSDYPDFSSKNKFKFTSKYIKDFTPVEIDIYSNIENKSYSGFIGIDIGSTSTKAILIDENKNVLIGLYTKTSGSPLKALQVIFESIDNIKTNYNTDFEIIGSGTTGSGRKFIGEIISVDIILDEITSHARAAYELNPKVDTIIEIGGQDSKFTTLQDGRVTFSIMNNVCAAGTGSFIEEQAKRLGCELTNYSERVDGVRAPLASDRCTVFMERDINFYISNGYTVEESLASVLHSVRENYLTKVAIEKNIGDHIFFQGATAKNRALVAAFEQRLRKPIMVSQYCHLTGALGTALTLYDQKIHNTNFHWF